MAKLYGPIDREVEVAEMRHLRMLQRLETNRLIAQARAENGRAAGIDRIQQALTKVTILSLARWNVAFRGRIGAAG